MRPPLTQLRSEVDAGRISRHGMLAEIERHPERTGQPIEGALEAVLEELHRSPGDPHAVRLLARLYERNGDLDSARRVLAPPDELPPRSVEDQLAVAKLL